MSNIESETGFLSLADLAAMETDEIRTLTSRIPDAGIFTVVGKSVSAAETRSDDPEKPPLFRFNFEYEIMEAKPLDKNADPEDFVGRTLKENFTLWPSDFTDMIGLLKGRYKLVGLDNTGRLGGVEGQEPGWMDGIVGHVFQLRVRHYTAKDGNDRAGFDWLKQENESDSEAA